MNRSQIKTFAKQQIKGNIALYFVASIIISLLTAIMGPITLLVLGPPLSFSLLYLAFDMAGGEKIQLGRVFAPFNDFTRVWCLDFLRGLFIFLWSLLLIVPGIIASLRYAMAPYILYENPEISSSEAIRQSKTMMYGHKGELFVLQLSFIPWFLLMIITLGLAGIYVAPYYNQTMMNYYIQLKNQQPVAQPADNA